ncbi:MAG: hypothetical protein LBH76_07685 [Propionibacteriaceae bacterium]|jgi:hypothetical protein|nr:hypothetical protein [Propionibacteriaceae bacterium]
MKADFATAFLRISGGLYLILAVNLLAMAAVAPLAVVVVATDLAQSWLAAALLATLLAPAAYAAFACFRGYAEGDTAVVRPYLRAWWAAWRRVGPFGLLAAAFTVVVIVDAMAVAGQPAAYAVVPALAAFAAVAWGALVTALAAAEEFGGLRRRDALKAGLACAVRGAGWTAVSVVATGLWAAAFTVKPVLASSLGAGPLLYLVWAGSRAALRPLRERQEASAAPPDQSGLRPAVHPSQLGVHALASAGPPPGRPSIPLRPPAGSFGAAAPARWAVRRKAT